MNLLQSFSSFSCFLVVLGLIAGCESPAPSNPRAPSSTTSDESTSAEKETTVDPASEESAETAGTKVLRHAVFFSFKPESTEEDIQRIVDAFGELPSKITEIIDFQWGVNKSKEGLDDGFTHCFLLTFQDEAGRKAYLPHPAHKAFGDVLRGHNDQVFVIDYWGDAGQQPVENELKHAVFLRFKKGTSSADIEKIETAFAALPSKIDLIKGFEWGINNSPEKHAAGFTHCFMLSFESETGLAAYLPHPDHKAFVEILKPVLDAPRVLDFKVEK